MEEKNNEELERFLHNYIKEEEYPCSNHKIVSGINGSEYSLLFITKKQMEQRNNSDRILTQTRRY